GDTGPTGPAGAPGPTGPTGPVATQAETCSFCHNQDNAVNLRAAFISNGVSVNQNFYHDDAASNALYKGSIAITSVTWADATTTTPGDSVVPTVTWEVRNADGVATAPSGPALAANSFSFTAVKYVLSGNAANNYQLQSVILNGANPSSANCSAAPTGTNPYTCTFTTRKILKTNWDPAGSDQLQVGMQLGSGFTVFNPDSGANVTFYANGTANLVGGSTIVPNDRAVVNTAACNDCHGLLRVHGRRVEAQYCATCHTSQINAGGVAGVGNFSYMVHGLHAAREMGLNYSFAGLVGAEITYPQDVRNCTTCHVPGLTGSDYYRTMVGVAACSGCHESVKFSPNAPAASAHQTFAVTTTSLCTSCHTPESIDSQHAIPAQVGANAFVAPNAPGSPAYSIVSVKSTAVGQFPVVTFRVNSAANSNIKTSPFWTQTATGASRLQVNLAWKVGNYTNAGA
ncbi:MAG TPA: hypothetical protein PLL32_02700, partial [Anaeromyxobacteraceae bacterium]|nr:hypothetical protein [Anaeromyxobacteraceae bacterium]